MRFTVWADGYQEPPNDSAIESWDADLVASEFAEREWDNSAGECGLEQIVNVRDESGVLRIFRIETEFSPTFYPHEITP